VQPARRMHTGTAVGQYGMCRQQSRGSDGVHNWSIAEALPGAAAHEMYALHGAGRSVDERIAPHSRHIVHDASQHATGCTIGYKRKVNRAHFTENSSLSPGF
jgi:hypothetical protein